MHKPSILGCEKDCAHYMEEGGGGDKYTVSVTCMQLCHAYLSSHLIIGLVIFIAVFQVLYIYRVFPLYTGRLHGADKVLNCMRTFLYVQLLYGSDRNYSLFALTCPWYY